MSPERRALVQRSWWQIAPIAEAAAGLFYRRLFEIDPSTRALFAHADPAEQRRKLASVLSAAVQGLNDIEALLPALRDLGMRHAGYGVRDTHYASVGAALLWTLKKGLGEAWTTEVEGAWVEVYRLLAAAMRDAATSAAPPAAACAAPRRGP
jgi:hemoglobin-like flavoprotein